MARQRSERLIEQTLDEFLERRIEEVDQPFCDRELRAEATAYQSRIGVVHDQADALIAPGLTFLILIFGTTVTVPTLNWAELAWSVPAAEAEAVAIAVMMRQVVVP
jgi:hypothetical protein